MVATVTEHHFCNTESVVGEAYAVKLRESGVDVTAIRFQGIIHDFVMLNSLDQTNAVRATMDVSTDWINRKNQG